MDAGKYIEKNIRRNETMEDSKPVTASEPKKTFLEDYKRASGDSRKLEYRTSHTEGDWCHVNFWDEKGREVEIKLSATVPVAEGGKVLRSVVEIDDCVAGLDDSILDLYYMHPGLNNEECVLWFENAKTVHFMKPDAMYNRFTSVAYNEIVLRHPQNPGTRYFVIVKDGCRGEINTCPLKLRLLLNIMRESILNGLYKYEYEIV